MNELELKLFLGGFSKVLKSLQQLHTGFFTFIKKLEIFSQFGTISLIRDKLFFLICLFHDVIRFDTGSRCFHQISHGILFREC